MQPTGDLSWGLGFGDSREVSSAAANLNDM